MTTEIAPPTRTAMAFVVPPVCMARQRRRPKRAGRRAPKGKITGPARNNSIPDADLVSQFSEDVKEPLVPGKGRKKGAGFSIDLPWKRFDISKLRDMKREEVLALLVRGSWIGIGVLVGYFLVVHLVIVRDFVPG